MIFGRRSWMTYLHHFNKQRYKQRYMKREGNMNNHFNSLDYSYPYYLIMNKHQWYLNYICTFGLTEGEKPGVMREWLQVSVNNGFIVHLFICTRRSMDEITFKSLTFTVNPKASLAPCSCDVVAVGGALEPCRSTAVGVVESLLTSPCFRRGLRTAVVMEHAGCHHYLLYRDEPDGTPVLFPVAWAS
jgi:hypothetical protein